MATESAVNELIDAIDGAIAYQNEDLISRADWGSIRFDEAEADLNRNFEILGYLKILPLDKLTDAAVSKILAELKGVTASLKQLDEFSIEQNQPSERRDQIVQDIHQKADAFYTAATPWIPFLAYQKGDVAENIESLTSEVSKAKNIVDNAKREAKGSKEEIDRIISATREASAAAGAAVFTHDFKNEAEELNRSALRWLVATGVLAGLTVVTSLATLFWVEKGLDTSATIQRFGGKIALFAILISATLWCGRIYRAQMHQATVNKHRALSLQTFQAFSSAAAEPQTKEAVLMETTKAIFSASPSGYIDSTGESKEQDIRIIDIGRSPVAPRVVESDASSAAS